MLHLVLLAVLAFASANIDDVFLLMGWLGGSPSARWHIYAGQFIGFGILALGSALCSLLAVRVTGHFFALFGIIPIGIGLHRLWQGWGRAAETASTEAATSKAISVALVTIGSGADDIAIFTPLMAKGGIAGLPLVFCVFLVMTGVWCGLATILVSHEIVADYLSKWGDRLMPIVLIGLGVYVIYTA